MSAIKSLAIYGFINGRPRAARGGGAGGVVGGRRVRRGGWGGYGRTGRHRREAMIGGFWRAHTTTRLLGKVPLPLHHSVIVRGTVLISETSVIGTRWLCAVPPRARSLFRPRVLGDLQRGLHSELFDFVAKLSSRSNFARSLQPLQFSSPPSSPCVFW